MSPGRIVRSALFSDRRSLARLTACAPNVHRHLDWRDALDWIGSPPFLVLEEDDELRAALACPPDPPQTAWLRLYVNGGPAGDAEVWQLLWEAACRQLARTPGLTAAAILTREWLLPCLESSGFTLAHEIVMLSCNGPAVAQDVPKGDFFIRPMQFHDLPAVAEVDGRAFETLWANSLTALSQAYRQAAIATVAEAQGRVIGYQISTRTALGVHLARLAVLPEAQGRGIGYALSADMMQKAVRRGVYYFTVNTQSTNAVSLALYRRLGFHESGERYPVYSRRIS